MILASLLLIALPQAEPPPDPPLDRSYSESTLIRDCGAYCVALVGTRVGEREVPFEQARDLVDADEDGLASMADLVRGLSSLGIEAAAVQAPLGGLPDGINILHVRSSERSEGEDHFIVSEALGDGQFRFYCPPLGTKTGDAETLGGIWAGRYVQIGSEPRNAWRRPAAFALAILVLSMWVVRMLRRSARAVTEGSHA